MDMGLQDFLIRPRGGWADVRERDVLHIGLVNNMPDAALESTERQFFRWVARAAPELPIRWHLFSLYTMPRSELGSLHLVREYYGQPRDIYRTRLHALIVTGTEPLQADLRQETYWPELTELFDWIDQDGPPALFSCLAAHAAVLHFDGIERQPLASKRFGVFNHVPVARHPVTASLTRPTSIAHSRWNDVSAEALEDAGYETLTYAPDAGVDLFIRHKRNELLFHQGHPEYDGETLGREYRRDVRRYLDGSKDIYPEIPANYFTATQVERLERFCKRAQRERYESLMSVFPAIEPPRNGGVAVAEPLGTWLRQIQQLRAERNGIAIRRRPLAGLQAP